jgi:hypothetical protein
LLLKLFAAVIAVAFITAAFVTAAGVFAVAVIFIVVAALIVNECAVGGECFTSLAFKVTFYFILKRKYQLSVCV